MANGKAGAPIGNKNAAVSKHAKNTLQCCLRRKFGEDTGEARPQYEALIAIWEKMYDKALEGDSTAANMIMDRMDGKPGQSIELGPDSTVNFNLSFDGD